MAAIMRLMLLQFQAAEPRADLDQLGIRAGRQGYGRHADDPVVAECWDWWISCADDGRELAGEIDVTSPWPEPVNESFTTRARRADTPLAGNGEGEAMSDQESPPFPRVTRIVVVQGADALQVILETPASVLRFSLDWAGAAALAADLSRSAESLTPEGLAHMPYSVSGGQRR